VDTSTPMGQMFIMLASIFDEYYAKDLSIRQKDSIAHRKRQGKAINLPFGTKRDADGFLQPSARGAWLLRDGEHVVGSEGQKLPDDSALWRGYFDCARRILEVYAENRFGADRIAYLLNLEGWAFQNRDGQSRPLDKEDVRRVVYNWPEYGGVVLGKRARRRSVLEVNPETVQLHPARAVFPLELLLQVGRVTRERAYRPRNAGVKLTSRTYALNGQFYCAHCEQRALEHNRPEWRSKFWGKTSKDSRYRHRDGSKGCGCTNRSVPCDQVEDDIGRLLHLMNVRENVFQHMVEHAIQMQSTAPEQPPPSKAKKQEALARCERRIQAARRLFRDGDMEEAEYDRILQECEQERAAWEQLTGEQEQVEYELKMCVEALARLVALWDAGDAEQRQALARSLFSHIIYDLDARRIVSFKLKPWAERFLELRIEVETHGDEVLNPVSVRWPRRGSGTKQYTLWIWPRQSAKLSTGCTWIGPNDVRHATTTFLRRSGMRRLRVVAGMGKVCPRWHVSSASLYSAYGTSWPEDVDDAHRRLLSIEELISG
jgi:hypothetical protein